MWPNLYGRPIFGPTLTCYGCCKCQQTHRKAIDPEYDAHLFFQSKHGTYERVPTTGERFAQIMAEEVAGEG